MDWELIIEKWGREREGDKELPYFNGLYNFLSDREEFYFSIDNITWSDLDMNFIFFKINHTMSLPGAQYLYNILRKPVFEETVLKKRNEIINSLLSNKDTSYKLQYPLWVLGKEKGEDIFSFFENGIDVDIRPLKIYQILSYLPLLAIIFLFIDIRTGVSIFLLIIFLNLYIYNRNKRKILKEIGTFKYVGELIKCAESIIKLDLKHIDLDVEGTKKLLKKIKKIKRNIFKLNYNAEYNSEIQILIDYFNMIVLREPRIFYKTVKLLNNHIEDILQLYINIGKVDAYVGVASYKGSLSYHTEPELVEDNTGFYINTQEIYHPLLKNPVPYTIELDNKGAIITGSNASGKSTFLKTIGINALFAQTLYFTFAENYNSNYIRLFTSIGTTDSIVEGDSYFMAEAKALKRIIDATDSTYPILCILDEIFRGTNTAERIGAARVVLDYLVEKNSCVIAATHDLELTSLVSERYENYHFKENIDNNDIKFDYILREGPCTSRNAIAILKYLGYPEDIYKKAMIKAEEYLN